jgi:RNA polymerase sigma-70 factor (ECF subfamily)
MDTAFAVRLGGLETRPPSLSDEDLARAAQRGDIDAFTALVTRYQRLVYRILWLRLGSSPEDAEDLTQEVFLRAWAHLGSYDADRPFKGWIGQVARNLAIDLLRARTRRPEALGLDDEALQALAGPHHPSTASGVPLADPPTAAEAGEERGRLLAHLRALPAPYRDVLMLRFVEDLSYDDIAALLGLPLGSVKTRIFRGRELLKRRLNDDEGRAA